ncbi:hypothetical protein [Pseudonocardia abyssalis]|uniref:SPW repeat-containing protein n=2 Tax=Pseudonocardiaceae TaxID=2070 RepID=A0ABS6V177_9PSEU|nr:hypothetical protein [Pseudonocardia abyssalis]MBW0114652.1 hypothetical protein [Pseudonocardia abyssalis]MBW0138275.1 hypothetical protein [Pseudonocardia abyssalis]
MDVAAAVRAASTGLTVLLLGGLMTPIAQAYLPVVGQFWLLLVSVVAFAAAGSQVGDAELAPVHGACAALGSFLLVLPLVFWFPPAGAGLDFAQIVSAAGAALVVGALAGHVAGRRRDEVG